MERLRDMLVEYNIHNIPSNSRRSWSDQFREQNFPRYWRKVFEVAHEADKNKRILEIGCGQGDVTSIFCYLGFRQIKSYEMDDQMSEVAIDKLYKLFGRNDIIICNKYPQTAECADILILVNCAYADACETKEDFIKKILLFYENAGNPELFLLEVIDPEYNIPDVNFPYCLRLSSSDINSMFPQASICAYETYRYPQNKRTKKLYIIKHSK